MTDPAAQNLSASNASRPLAGRTALVTGGSRGIGRACSVRLAEAGANVAINYRSDEKAAREAARLVEQAGVRSLAVAADVSSSEDVTRMIAEIEQTLCPVDLLINNAGVFDFAPHGETRCGSGRSTSI